MQNPTILEPAVNSNTYAESAVVGTLAAEWTDPPAPHCGLILRHAPDSFDDQRHGIIAATINELWLTGRAVNLFSIRDELKRAGKLDQIGGMEFLQTLAASGVGATLAEHEATGIWAAYTKTRIQSVLRDSADAIEARPGAISSIVATAQKAIRALSGDDKAFPAILDAAAFMALELPELKEVVHGLLHQGSKLSLGGSSKSFKTWTLLDLTLSVSHGKPWLSFPTTAGKVLYVNFEIQPRPWQDRLRVVANAKGITIQPGRIHLLNLRGKAADHATLLPLIRDAIVGQDFALIVLDPIYKLYGGTDENAAGDVAALLNGLESLAVETGAAVAFGAHFSKGNQAGKESIDRVSGSGVFARDPDSLLVMTKHEEENAFTVEATLRNFPQVEPFCVRWEYPLMRPDSELDPAKLKQAAGRKATSAPDDLLKLIQEKPLTKADWMTAAAASRPSVGKSKFYDQFNELVKRGKAIITTGDKWKIA